MLGLPSNVTTQELDRLIGINQPFQQKLDELTNSSKLHVSKPLSPLTIVSDAVTGQPTIRLTSNMYIQDLDNVIGATSSVQAQLKKHDTNIVSLLDSRVTSSKALNASSAYVYDHNADTI